MSFLERRVPALVQENAIVAGEDYAFVLIVLQKAGVALDLVGYTARASIRDQARDATARGPLIADFDVNFADAATGQLRLTLDRTLTVGISAGDYTWDVWIRDPVGEVAYLRKNTVTVEVGATEPPT